METLYPILVSVHSLAGAVSLLTFWLAAFARKGGPLHRGSGKVYLVAMLGICVTALPMAATFFLRGQNGIATFRKITTGIIGGLQIEVDGVADGTSIVSGPFQALRELADGARVKPRAATP